MLRVVPIATGTGCIVYYHYTVGEIWKVVYSMILSIDTLRFARAKALDITRGLLNIFRECMGNAIYMPKLFWLVAPLLLLE